MGTVITKLNIDGILYQFLSEYTPPIYSTEEWIPTNETWIDGKKIYQKVLTKDSFNGVSHHDENIETFISYTGWIKRDSNSRKDVIPMVLLSNTYGNSSTVLAYDTNSAKNFDLMITSNGNFDNSFVDCEIIVKVTLINEI